MYNVEIWRRYTGVCRGGAGRVNIHVLRAKRGSALKTRLVISEDEAASQARRRLTRPKRRDIFGDVGMRPLFC